LKEVKEEGIWPESVTVKFTAHPVSSRVDKNGNKTASQELVDILMTLYTDEVGCVDVAVLLGRKSWAGKYENNVLVSEKVSVSLAGAGVATTEEKEFSSWTARYNQSLSDAMNADGGADAQGVLNAHFSKITKMSVNNIDLSAAQ